MKNRNVCRLICSSLLLMVVGAAQAEGDSGILRPVQPDGLGAQDRLGPQDRLGTQNRLGPQTGQRRLPDTRIGLPDNLAKFDADADGSLSRDEIQGDVRLRTRFPALDRDDDGLLGPDELPTGPDMGPDQ